MRAWWAIVLCLPAIATGQGTCNSGTPLRLGDIKVAFSTTVTLPTNGDPAEAYNKRRWATRQICGDTVAQDNLIHRVLYDGEHRPYFGYDIRIAPVPATKMFRIEVTRPTGRITAPNLRVGSTPGKPEIDGNKLRSFQKFPEPATIADGDRVTLPVLQDPKTGAVVVIDSFEIGGANTPVQALPNLSGIPREPPTGTLLHLEEPELSTAVSDFGSNPEMGVTGPVVWLYTPRPRPGYLKKAFAEGVSAGGSI